MIMMKMMIKVSSYLSVSCVERIINSTIRGGWHLPQIKLCRFPIDLAPPSKPHPTSKSCCGVLSFCKASA